MRHFFRFLMFFALALPAFATPPGYDAECQCYRNVEYAPGTFAEPTRGGELLAYVYDIWPPTGPQLSEPRPLLPVVFWGHANGTTHSIAYSNSPNSTYQRLVKPLRQRGFIFVAYEFRHPAVNDPYAIVVNDRDPQTAINHFFVTYGADLNADPANVFLAGVSRGGGMAIWTGLDGVFSPGIDIRAVWAYNAQTAFRCTELAQRYIIPADWSVFFSRPDCNQNTGLPSSVNTATPQMTSPPLVARYEGLFIGVPVPEAAFGVHHPDFGLSICVAYGMNGTEPCTPMENIATVNAWDGMPAFFIANLTP